MALTVAAATLGVWIARDCAFWLLLPLLAAGFVLTFVHIPAVYTVWALVGLAVFGLGTVIDFNRLGRAGAHEAIPLAAGIFLDVLNVFLLFLWLFGRSSQAPGLRCRFWRADGQLGAQLDRPDRPGGACLQGDSHREHEESRDQQDLRAEHEEA